MIAAPARPSSARVIVLGYIVRGPLGGLTWHHLQYMQGLLRLGHDAYFVEDSDDYPACYDPSSGTVGTDPSYGLRYTSDVFERAGMADRWAYHDMHRGRWHGPLASRIDAVCRAADIVLNVSGVNPIRSWLREVPVKALIDTDPVFTQIRHLTDDKARACALEHNVYFTFGENFGQPGCQIPDDGLPWQPTRQPVVLDAWPVRPVPARSPFTTVMQWDSYPSREYNGTRYGMKSDSFGPYAELPGRTGMTLELSLGGASAPRDWLIERGWRLSNPLESACDPWSFQGYIQQSSGEFTVAKHGYVASQSGWFSERSANYLASGRPVVCQDTGFGRWLTADHGLRRFSNADEAAETLAQIGSDLPRHARAAREIAEVWFDSKNVLGRLLTQCEQASRLEQRLGRTVRDSRHISATPES